jgi:hypothetical protein
VGLKILFFLNFVEKNDKVGKKSSTWPFFCWVFCGFWDFASVFLFRVWWDCEVVGLGVLVLWLAMMWGWVWVSGVLLWPRFCQYSVWKSEKKGKKIEMEKKMEMAKFGHYWQTLPRLFSLGLVLIM